MKRILSVVFLLAVAAGGVACGGTKGNRIVDGVVYDATMNGFSVVDRAGDSLLFWTEGLPDTLYRDVLLEDSVRVTYAPETMEGGVRVLRPCRVEILRHSPYYDIAGIWTEPSPCAPEGRQGIRIDADGSAASIGMATLRFASWSIEGNTLLTLQGESIGNGVTSDIQQTYTILRLDADSLILAEEGRVVWRLARQR